MRNFNPGSIFFFIFLFIVANNMFGGIPFFLPMILFFVVYNAVSKKKNANKDRGYVRESTKRRRSQARDQRDYDRARQTQRRRDQARQKPVIKKNPFKKSGVDKFKDYDYDGAIEDFTRALQIDGKDPSVYFNLACAFSLTEQKDKAFDALSKAFTLGFKDSERLKTHDALAYLRVQDEFESFVANGYKWPISGARKPMPEEQSELLQQLKQLADLREKGLLTDEEFLTQKKRLLN